MMGKKCPCLTDAQSCCACVSMRCDECHKPMQSKFVLGRFCSNCGRPLKAELQSEFEELKKQNEALTINMNAYGLAIIRLKKDKDALIKKHYKSVQKIFDEIEKHTFSYGYAVRNDMSVAKTRRIDEDCLLKLKKKYTEGQKDV